MSPIELKVTKREVLGKKVKALRRQGITPAHVFGHGIESMSVQSQTVQLQRSLAKAGKTQIINLVVDKEKARPVVLRNLDTDPITGEVLHVDFYQVRMDEKVKVQIPIVLIGESPALKTKGSLLNRELDNLTVECLPDKIPASVEMDLGAIVEPDQAIHVADVKLDDCVTILDDAQKVIAKVTVHIIEEKVEEKPAAAAVPGEEGAAPAAAVEGGEAKEAKKE